MATVLDKDLTRETTVIVDDREVVLTLTEDQKVVMKLKGMKSGAVQISIEDLYKQLTGKNEVVVESDEKEDKPKRKSKNDEMSLSLYDIRHKSAVRGWDYETTAKFDEFLAELIDDIKNPNQYIVKD